MKKEYFLLLVAIFTILISCNQVSNKYHGYVYDEDRPLAKVKIVEEWYNPSRFTETDSNGYFELERKDVIGNLIFLKDGYKVDTIVPYKMHACENVSYTFLNRKPDTIRLTRISEKFE